MSIQEYIDKHSLKELVETAINACVKEKPQEPISYLSQFLAAKAAGGDSDLPFGSITKVVGRMIIDSRGNPTCEADVFTSKGMFRAAVPSGASTGIHEAVELRDKDKTKWMGKGVSQAVDNINNKLAPALIGMDPTNQQKIDEQMMELDGIVLTLFDHDFGVRYWKQGCDWS